MPPKAPAPTLTVQPQSLTQLSFRPFGEVIANPQHHAETHYQSTTANQGTATKFLDITHMENHYHLSQSRKPAKVSMNMFVCKPRKLEARGADGAQCFPVEILERHPFTPQTFVPIGLGKEDKATKYLVIVAPTLPSNARTKGNAVVPPYPIPPPPTRRRSLRERLMGARPNPFTNDFAPSTTPAAPASTLTSRPRGPGLPDLRNVKAFVASGDQAVTYGPGTWHAPMVVLGERPVEFVVFQYANGVSSEDCQELEMDVETGQGGIAVVTGEVAALDIEGEMDVRAKL